MNVKFLSVATVLEGLIIKDLGRFDESDFSAWRGLEVSEGSHLFEVRSTGGVGCIVAGAVGSETSEALPTDPSSFFLMD
jgi:hypothetical protein